MVDTNALEHELSRSVNCGPLILIVGPSGVGKDSLIEGARLRLSDEENFRFPNRYITRPTDYGGENHHSIEPSAFNRLQREGGFALHWRAHGFAYGIANGIHDDLNAGHAVVVNGSRGIVDHARERFASFHAARPYRPSPFQSRSGDIRAIVAPVKQAKRSPARQ